MRTDHGAHSLGGCGINYHLHVFTKGADQYGVLDSDDDFDLGHRDERAATLNTVLWISDTAT